MIRYPRRIQLSWVSGISPWCSSKITLCAHCPSIPVSATGLYIPLCRAHFSRVSCSTRSRAYGGDGFSSTDDGSCTIGGSVTSNLKNAKICAVRAVKYSMRCPARRRFATLQLAAVVEILMQSFLGRTEYRLDGRGGLLENNRRS